MKQVRTNGSLTSFCVRSPKRGIAAGASRAGWFQYYAGFSPGFVEDIITRLDLRSGAIILDPWLGSGTTSEIATIKGYSIRGYDLNPAMLLVAKARTLPTNATDSVSILLDSVCDTYRQRIKNCLKDGRAASEPLEQWLQPASASVFRFLERTVFATAPDSSSMTPLWRHPSRVPTDLAFLYVGLFRTLRYFVSEFQSSNPTWVKTSDGKARIFLPAERILNRFRKEIHALLTAMQSETQVMPPIRRGKCVIDVASSLDLPLSSKSIDAVISSPPYCTRIDYVRATLPELAVIGYPNGDFIRHLRNQMIGTPTIDNTPDGNAKEWGAVCSRFLKAVQQHASKASSTYYLKCYRQYFGSVFESMREINRVLKPSGKCILVVQDSYYKNIRSDLPRIFIEIANGLGWSLRERLNFPVKQTLAGINPEVKRYRSVFQALESVLHFSK
jgi:SAM-dependent methyltransferase